MARTLAQILEPLNGLSDCPGAEAVVGALRGLAQRLNGADPLRRAAIRASAIERLGQLHVSAPARLVDAALSATHENDDTTQGRAIVLSDVEPWPQAVDGDELLAELEHALTRFIVLPKGAAIAGALWIVHAHAHDASEISPLLAITSPVMRCGKSLLLQILERLVPRPLMTVNISLAGVFRAVERFHPTLLVDEGDTFLRYADELRGLLNAGHSRQSAYVVRNVGDEHQPKLFRVWCPKALSLIGRLPPTLHDRAIVIPMKRRGKFEASEPFRQKKLRGLEPLRRRAARWARDHLAALRVADPAMADGLDSDRGQDNWRPLLAIADLAGGDWPQRAREAALLLSGAEARVEDTMAIQLLSDIRGIFGRRREKGMEWPDRIASVQLTADLVDLGDRPWAELKRGRPLSQGQLARLLRPFGIASGSIRVGGYTPKGYHQDQFQDAWDRYLPPVPPISPPQSATTPQAAAGAGLSPKSKAQHGGAVADRKWAENPDAERGVALLHFEGAKMAGEVGCPACGALVPELAPHWQQHTVGTRYAFRGAARPRLEEEASVERFTADQAAGYASRRRVQLAPQGRGPERWLSGC